MASVAPGAYLGGPRRLEPRPHHRVNDRGPGGDGDRSRCVADGWQRERPPQFFGDNPVQLQRLIIAQITRQITTWLNKGKQMSTRWVRWADMSTPGPLKCAS